MLDCGTNKTFKIIIYEKIPAEIKNEIKNQVVMKLESL
jgi:hypothetical protein